MDCCFCINTPYGYPSRYARVSGRTTDSGNVESKGPCLLGCSYTFLKVSWSGHKCQFLLDQDRSSHCDHRSTIRLRTKSCTTQLYRSRTLVSMLGFQLSRRRDRRTVERFAYEASVLLRTHPRRLASG